MRVLLICIMLAAAQPGIANAASVIPVQGSVALNTGAGFADITTETPASDGDWLNVTAGAAADVVYTCRTVRIPAGSVVEISQTSACPEPAEALDTGATENNKPAATEASTGVAEKPGVPESTGANVDLVAMSAAGIGVAIGLAAFAGGDKPASP